MQIPNRDIDIRFNWKQFKTELLEEIPQKYHKEVIEAFDFQTYFKIKTKQVEFAKLLFGFPSVGLQSLETRNYKANKLFDETDKFLEKMKEIQKNTRTCFKDLALKSQENNSLEYKQCIVNSQNQYEENFDKYLSFFDRELPYVNPLLVKLMEMGGKVFPGP